MVRKSLLRSGLQRAGSQILKNESRICSEVLVSVLKLFDSEWNFGVRIANHLIKIRTLEQLFFGAGSGLSLPHGGFSTSGFSVDVALRT